MRATPTKKQHTESEKQRVLDAFSSPGTDWMKVAEHNDIPRSTAYRLVKVGRAKSLPRGGARASRTKVTPEMRDALQGYLEENASYTLGTMQRMLWMDFGVKIGLSTISDHLVGLTYTMKQLRTEPVTCNHDVNKQKRKKFAEKLLKHQREGDMIVYYDETNFNVYTKRSAGRAKKGERAVIKVAISQGANLQIQCAVASSMGLVHYRLQRGSIRMDKNAAFVEEIYDKIKASSEYASTFRGKKIVIVFDNAPAHNQTEGRVVEHDDLVLLRLAPYSPMCNPIEGCFSVLKAKIKNSLALNIEDMCARPPCHDEDGNFMTLTEFQMQALERAADSNMRHLTPYIVGQMELHARDFVLAASRFEDMHYGK